PHSEAASKSTSSSRAISNESVDLRKWATEKGFTVDWHKPSGKITLKARWSKVEMVYGSRRIEIDGVGVWLSFPIGRFKNSIGISEKDIATVLEPILFPKRGSTPIRLVALDPGHGGKDPGFQRGPHQEKEYTLKLAREVQELLSEAGLQSFLTRRSDTFIDLDERPAIAKKQGADLMVSLHFNCAPDLASVQGVETFCATPHGTSSTSGGEPVLLPNPGNKHDPENVLLAYHVQKAIITQLGMNDRGVRRAGFIVLKRSSLPTILVEGGFMSHREDSAIIFSDARRKKMAQAIVDGILAYKRLKERVPATTQKSKVK
ncbi:MAG: N-acetylmuramoyl-L-alanine amidase, partial [Verrucomicrobiota bacterium]|nr:N-acetylmuramoyl-L-alanine amidase [Verrucomicrobiota bacterium]